MSDATAADGQSFSLDRQSAEQMKAQTASARAELTRRQIALKEQMESERAELERRRTPGEERGFLTAKRRYISPLRYPGGKARMSGFLGDLFERQVSSLDIEVWVEPFAGGAGAGLALLDARVVSEVWLTEKHPALAALWRSILAEPEALAARVEAAVPDMVMFDASRETVSEPANLGDIDVAFAALVVNRCSRSGIVTPRVGPIGGRDQNGKWGLTSRWNPAGLAERIRYVGQSLGPRIRFAEGDAVGAVSDLAGSGVEDEVMLFVDPPYLREGNRLYANGMSAEDHQRLADALNSCEARWILTYDDEPLVADVLYPQRRVLAYQIANTANRARIATEFAVLSDNLALGHTVEVLPGAEGEWLRGPEVARAPMSVAAA